MIIKDNICFKKFAMIYISHPVKDQEVFENMKYKKTELSVRLFYFITFLSYLFLAV